MAADLRTRVKSLTQRQREIVRLISLGCTNIEIGRILGLSPNTVDIHRTRAMAVLGIGRATLLTRIAIKSKLSPLDDELTPAERRKLKQKAKPKKRAGGKRKPAR